jgi:nitrile hydratase subunit beta
MYDTSQDFVPSFHTPPIGTSGAGGTLTFLCVSGVAWWDVGTEGVTVRINDVGGLQGFGPVEVDEPEEPFHFEWESRVFALVRTLLRSMVVTLDEFRDAIERMPPAEYLNASYYERWLAGLCTLLTERGLVRPEELA